MNKNYKKQGKEKKKKNERGKKRLRLDYLVLLI